ncbi:Dedicator Of Cytokinesis Protein 1 [Manis pentadactyla]|nr:Dedicator Of Cytokinesis Protein 1 [Manis pentadactyla]
MDFRCLSLKLLGNYLVLSTIWVGPWQNVKQEKLAFGCSAIILGRHQKRWQGNRKMTWVECAFVHMRTQTVARPEQEHQVNA